MSGTGGRYLGYTPPKYRCGECGYGLERIAIWWCNKPLCVECWAPKRTDMTQLQRAIHELEPWRG